MMTDRYTALVLLVLLIGYGTDYIEFESMVVYLLFIIAVHIERLTFLFQED